MKRKLKGFTLVELVICIAIIAILVGMAIPQFNKAKISAIASTHNSNVQAIKSAAIMASIYEDDSDLTTKCAKYIEGGKLPDIPKEIGDHLGTTWSIKKDDNGNIEVKPGLVKVENGAIVASD